MRTEWKSGSAGWCPGRRRSCSSRPAASTLSASRCRVRPSPDGKAGYYAWRRSLFTRQAGRCRSLLLEAGYTAARTPTRPPNGSPKMGSRRSGHPGPGGRRLPRLPGKRNRGLRGAARRLSGGKVRRYPPQDLEENESGGPGRRWACGWPNRSPPSSKPRPAESLFRRAAPRPSAGISCNSSLINWKTRPWNTMMSQASLAVAVQVQNPSGFASSRSITSPEATLRSVFPAPPRVRAPWRT